MTIETKKTHQKAGVKRPNFQSGFSIIELTIILAIFAFFAVNLLVTDETSKTFQKYDDTLDKMRVIQEALDKYVVEFGHYPCPADGTLPINAGGNLALGDSTWTSLTLTTGAADCRNANFVANTLDAAYRPPTASVEDDLSQHIGVFVGVVPTRDLGLPMDYMIDSFGNRLTYAVRKELTTTLSFALSTNADPTTGAAPSWPFGAASNITLQFVNSAGSIANNAAYLVVSHGANGYGAYPYEQGIPKANGSYGATRIFPPNAVGGAWDCNLAHDSSTNPIGTYSAGELENHHLCEEIVTLATTASLNKVGGVFDAKFFTANVPELPAAGSTSILAYDDLIVGNNQISHDLTASALSDGSQPLIKFYEDPNGTDGGGKSPDQFLGLAAWFDAQECSTIIDDLGNNMCNSNTTNNVLNWAEKISLFNNYYKNSLVAVNTYGSTAKSSRPGTGGGAPGLRPDYDPALHNINNRPAIYFNGVQNILFLEGPFTTAGLIGEASFGTDTDALNNLTIFAVVKTPATLSTNQRQAIFGRTNNFLMPNTAPADSDGYSLFLYNASGPDWSPNQFGFGVNNFNSSTNVLNLAQIAAGPTINPDTSYIIAVTYRYDSSTDTGTAQIFDVCNLSGSQTINPNGGITHSLEQTYAGLTQPRTAAAIGDMWLRSNNTGNFEGLIGEIIFYERALTDYERIAVTRYLEEKWGFTPNCDPTAVRPDVTAAFPASGTTGDAIRNNAATGIGCAGRKLLGDNTATVASDCCSDAINGASTCCMIPYQLHIEKCKSNNDCCTGACSAFGYCYSHDLTDTSMPAHAPGTIPNFAINPSY